MRRRLAMWTEGRVVLLLVLCAPCRLYGQGTVSGVVMRGSQEVGSAVVQLIPVEAGNGAVHVVDPDTALIDQSHLRFAPGVIPIQAGSTVEFLNSDRLMHNVFSPGSGSAGFDLGTYPMGESRFHTFDTEGSYVILCHVHPEMVAWVVVSPTRHAGVTGEDGAFEVASVPAGSYRVHVWHRRWTHDAGPIEVPAAGVARWTIQVDKRSSRGDAR